MKPKIWVYADTSVYGGVHDEEFSAASAAFFDLTRQGRFGLVVSDVLRQEIDRAPQRVRAVFEQHLGLMKYVPLNPEILALRDAYLEAAILNEKWAEDAAHVASATIAGAGLIVSWNIRHIVHFDKIRMYNAVNALKGYTGIEIRSPAEVIEYEDEDI